ncbi:MAG: hypothetical protein GTO02_11635 [Candidatus Dadabacteria bacterium]|nr:hypothetical protein [Candidatus Dadabacteria bacterium]NIQ15007.1 hypothetical protein [Candidatus Dadabacteria bacterium]
MTNNINKLFVYGTLRKGEVRSKYLKDLELISSFIIPGKLYKTPHNYPIAQFDNTSSNKIHGELYNILPSKNNINNLDELEGINEGYFKRSEIFYNNNKFYLYEPDHKLQNYVNDINLIPHGNWLTHNGLAISKPLMFAKNFEDIHKNYYRKKSNNKFEETVCLHGNLPILITCPHSTVHTRENKLKRQEFYTAAIGSVLHSKLDCFCLYSNRMQNSDPNYYDSSNFKEVLKNTTKKNNIKFIVDIHGTGEKRKSDIYPGIGNNKEFLLKRNDILDLLYSISDKHNIKVGSLDVFPAAKQMTIAKYAARNLNVPCMQIEINQKLRFPENDQNFLKMINFLCEFIKEFIKK